MNGFGGNFGNGFGNAGGFGAGAQATFGQGSQQGAAGFGQGTQATFGQGAGFGAQPAAAGFGGFGGAAGVPQQSFAQKNLGNNFNLLGPVNAGAVDVAKVNAIKTIMVGAESAINNIILKLVSEHASKRPTIVDLFNGVDLKGCQLDIAYKTGIPMCPTFTITKHLSGGTAAGGFFGPGLGSMNINGVSANLGGVKNETGPAMKMEIIINKFIEVVDILKDVNMNESFEIRTPGCNINYIAQTGGIMLTPSTLILNNNKNDARKIASNM